MDLTTIRTEVQRRTGRDFADAAALSVINEALQRYSLERDWPWLFVTWYFTGDGETDSFLLPPRRSVAEVRVGDLRVEQTVYQGTQTSGWWISGANSLRLRPAPGDGDAIEVDAYRLEDTLESAGDEPFVPDAHIYGVLDLAAAMVLDRTGRSEDGDAFRSRYREWRDATDRLMHPTSTLRIRTRSDSPL